MVVQQTKNAVQNQPEHHARTAAVMKYTAGKN
jgi:hypothetical protein